MKRKFSVTYSIITPESAKQGDFDETGYEIENGSFRECFSEVRNYGYIEASCSRLRLCDNCHCWFTAYGETDYRDGSKTQKSFHASGITPASHRRIARLFGLKV